jgi:hypothetical protein
MRTGKNPAKSGIPAYSPKELGLALITYIPFQAGYFQHSLEILRFQIASVRETTPGEFDLLVFDNGSSPAVVAELKGLYSQGWIDWLILSRHNLGKVGAWNWIFAAMPNELICYSDSDVLFRSGWLQASRQLVEAFPKVGIVTAQPNFHDILAGSGRAHLALQQDDGYVLGEYLPAAEIVDEYCLGIGASEELAARFRHKPIPKVTSTRSGAQAVVGASHMQFLIPRQVARQLVPLPNEKGLWRSETKQFNLKVDALGYLHLSTLEPYVFHMGNTLSDAMLAKVQAVLGPSQTIASRPEKRDRKEHYLVRLLAAMARRPRLNRLLLRAYNLLFRALYPGE